MSESTALLLVDFINDIVHPEGKLAAKGYHQFSSTHKVPEAVQSILAGWRKRRQFVVHMRVGFLPGYADLPGHSPLFGKAEEFGVLQQGTWGTEIADFAAPLPGEPVLTKPRVNSFFNTGLHSLLIARHISSVFICGVATDLAVHAAAFSAHDRDYGVHVVADACAAASFADHDNALKSMGKIATVVKVGTVG